MIQAAAKLLLNVGRRQNQLRGDKHDGRALGYGLRGLDAIVLRIIPIGLDDFDAWGCLRAVPETPIDHGVDIALLEEEATGAGGSWGHGGHAASSDGRQGIGSRSGAGR